MAVTVRDVARLAGVSPRTVSNVVHNFQQVSDETRARVHRAIEELGYRPNLVARRLRQGRSGLVVLAIPELAIPYFSELAGALIEAAAPHGYTVVIEQTDGKRENEEQLLERGTETLLADGLILSPLTLDADDVRRDPGKVPVVLLGEYVEGSRFDHVGMDNLTAARVAVEHLASLGRRRIAAIGHQSELIRGEIAYLRTEGYRQALEEAGLPFDPTLLVPTGPYHRDSGAHVMRVLLELPEPPDAVFCFNDLLAIGALRVLAEERVRVPAEIAVAGFDDIEEGRYSNPTLTTISPDKSRIAAAALEQLLARLAGQSGPAVRLEAPFELVVRESTVGPRRRRRRSPGQTSPPT